MKLAAIVAACALVMAGSGPSLSQEGYPARPVRLLVGFPPGTATDLVARQIAEGIKKNTGWVIYVDNKVGQSGSIAARELVRSAPDGYTLLVTANRPLITNPTGASARMRKGQRRNLVARHLPLSPPASLASRRQNEIDVGLEVEDGLSAQLLRIAPKSSLQLPDFSLGSGVSMLVAAGEVVFGGKQYGTWSCLHARQDEISPELFAGLDGAEVLFLRYPRPALTS
jgi:hypothetical protein